MGTVSIKFSKPSLLIRFTIYYTWLFLFLSRKVIFSCCFLSGLTVDQCYSQYVTVEQNLFPEISSACEEILHCSNVLREDVADQYSPQFISCSSWYGYLLPDPPSSCSAIHIYKLLRQFARSFFKWLDFYLTAYQLFGGHLKPKYIGRIIHIFPVNIEFTFFFK